MLLTICPNCSAQFKVQPEQLNVRQGRVMCGRCRHVFNAFQSLSRVEDATEFDAASAVETTRAPESQPLTTIPALESTSEPISDRFFLKEEPSPLPALYSASEALSQPAADATATVGVSGRFSSSYIPSDYSSAEEPRPSQSGMRDTKLHSPAIDLSGENNPLLIEPASTKVVPAASTSSIWRLGVFVLLVGFIAQTAYAFRNTLVTHYPQLRPYAGELCEIAGCSLSWGRDEASLKIEASELIEAPGKPGRILLTAILVNRGKAKQDMPSLELRLTDNTNQVVVSRLLNPADYLGRAISKGEGLAPDTELYVNVDFKLELSNKPPASGYGLIVFYP